MNDPFDRARQGQRHDSHRNISPAEPADGKSQDQRDDETDRHDLRRAVSHIRPRNRTERVELISSSIISSVDVDDHVPVVSTFGTGCRGPISPEVAS